MRTNAATFLMLALCLASSTTDARTARSHSAKRDFVAVHPCPATGSHKVKRCLGYVIDHIKPLCAGGPDAPHNMQWQTVSDAKVKDRWERQLCRRR